MRVAYMVMRGGGGEGHTLLSAPTYALKKLNNLRSTLT